MSNQTNQAILDFSSEAQDTLGLTGEKIIADRYLQKGGTLEIGAVAMAVVNKKSPKPELGRVIQIKNEDVTLILRDGSNITVPSENLDILKERAPRHMWKRIAKGVVAGMPEEKQAQWSEKFYGLQQGWKYLPGGRINASMGAEDANGNPVKTTSYNCFVIPNVGPTIADYANSFGRSLEIQARSGGVGMNLSFVLPQGEISPVKPLRKSDVQLVMDVWHPDLLDFVEETPIDRISNPYQHSLKVVRINSEFKQALAEDSEFTFEFPDVQAYKDGVEIKRREVLQRYIASIPGEELHEGMTEEAILELAATFIPKALLEDLESLAYDNIWNGDLQAWKAAGYPVKTGTTLSAKAIYQTLVDHGVTLVDHVLFAKEVSPGDSRGTIAKALGQTWETLLSGNQAAVILSHLRPRYSRVVGVNGRSSGAYSWGALYSKANWAYANGFGPVAVADIMSTGCLLTIQGGSRRGALMIALNDWHQDIMKFIQAKRDMSMINGANVSVAISEEFMVAKNSTDADWNLGFVGAENFNKYEASYFIDENDFVATTTIAASEIWDEMMRSAWASAEPGVIFMGRYNNMSNSYYFSEIIATNPCGKMLASR